MSVAELIKILQAMRQDLPVYWDNSEGMEQEEVKSAYPENSQFSKYKRGRDNLKFLGYEYRDVAMLSWREPNNA